ncbi:MAG: hypothetical protein MZV70_02555 [Desulfobacterales bacterium]|nr:hypothetical protein [Desulfobacterales bacterium]
MTPEQVLRIGMAVASVVKTNHGRNMVLIGKDTRLSGYMIESALTSGICSMGVDVTPRRSRCRRPASPSSPAAMRADAGIVISASHNPYEDNGIKIFSVATVSSCLTRWRRSIERLDPRRDRLARPAAHGDRDRQGLPDRRRRRPLHRVRQIDHPQGPEPRRAASVVVDCGQRRRLQDRPARLLEELGAEVDRRSAISPNGMQHQRRVRLPAPRDDSRATVTRARAPTSGIAHRRRCRPGSSSSTRRARWSTATRSWPSARREMIERRPAARQTRVVATVMSNLGLERALEQTGASARADAGRRPLRCGGNASGAGYNLGGEQSGTHHLPRPQHDGRRPDHGAPGPLTS